MKRTLLSSQILILVLSFLWGLYFVAYERTQIFGVTWRNFVADALVVFVAVMPMAVPGVLGLPWRKASLLLSALCVGMIALVEIYAGVQERWVLRCYGDDPGRAVCLDRWPPYGDHQIRYSLGYGWIGSD